MKVRSAEFIMSNSNVMKAPKDRIPEYAFIGRSNVGKSSLINMLTNKKKLAKTLKISLGILREVIMQNGYLWTMCM